MIFSDRNYSIPLNPHNSKNCSLFLETLIVNDHTITNCYRKIVIGGEVFLSFHLNVTYYVYVFKLSTAIASDWVHLLKSVLQHCF